MSSETTDDGMKYHKVMANHNAVFNYVVEHNLDKQIDAIVNLRPDIYTQYDAKKLDHVVVPMDLQAAIEGLDSLLRLTGEDPDREGVVETPMRFIKAFLEMTNGYAEDPRKHLEKNFSINDTDDDLPAYDELIISGGIPFSSLCEHHLLGFSGTIDIGYIPNPDNGRIVGLSKLARMADGYARRLQVQERLTQQIAHAIQQELDPLGVAVVVRGRHGCQCYRGIKKDGYMVTSSMSGVFKELGNNARSEFLSLIGR